MMRYFIVGGAGFIGSHLVRRLIQTTDAQVTIFDNFSSGRMWRLGEAAQSSRLTIVRGDVKELPALTQAMAGHDHVFHFASNPDIAKALTQPDIDFWEGTFLTQNVLEAMRQSGVRKLTYASGSGVYGDTGQLPVYEDYAPLMPISTYGASKLAGETLICAYAHMFELSGMAFRFANVIGPRQSHGVSYDFILRLLSDPTQLRILGDGSQSKSYVHVDDVLDAMLLIAAGVPKNPKEYASDVKDPFFPSSGTPGEGQGGGLGPHNEQGRLVERKPPPLSSPRVPGEEVRAPGILGTPIAAQNKAGKAGFEYFNVATEDYLTVSDIADLVVSRLGLSGVKYNYTGGDRGWKGDVPVVRFDTRKLRGRGWSNRRTCRQAMIESIDSMIADARAGKLNAAQESLP